MNATQIILNVLNDNVEEEPGDRVTNEAIATMITNALAAAGKLQDEAQAPTPETEAQTDQPATE